MKETDKAYIAGVIESRKVAARLQTESRKPGNQPKWYLQFTATGTATTALKKISSILEAPVSFRICQGSLAERTSLQGRPAVFCDGTSSGHVVRIYGYQIQKLIQQIKPYIDRQTLDRFKDVLRHDFSEWQKQKGHRRSTKGSGRLVV